MTAYRLSSGGLVNRGRPLSFKFDGKDMKGMEGDTLAAALLANDQETALRQRRHGLALERRPGRVVHGHFRHLPVAVAINAGIARDPQRPVAAKSQIVHLQLLIAQRITNAVAVMAVQAIFSADPYGPVGSLRDRGDGQVTQAICIRVVPQRQLLRARLRREHRQE